MALTVKQIKVGVVVNTLFGYHASTTIVGLLAHPYNTVQDIVRESIPTVIIFFPVLCWVVGSFFLRLLEHFLFSILPFFGLWLFLFLWGTFFLLFWQILLAYLYVRFSKTLRE